MQYESKDLRPRVVGGLLWATAGRFAAQLVTWCITIVVIRLLSPADYGLVAMAMIFVGLLNLLAEAGLGAAIVQARVLTAENLRAILGAVILFDVALGALQIGVAPAAASLFDEQRLIPILQVLAMHFLLAMFVAIPNAMLVREMDFRKLAMVQMASSSGGALATLGLALSGYGVWALVLGSLISQLVQAIGLNLVRPSLMWPDFSLRGVRNVILFGGQLAAARALWFVYSQADLFIAGKLLGKETLGFYSVSMHLASLPVQRMSAIVNDVAFPAFARIQQDMKAAAEYLLKALRLLGFVSIPVLWGISSIAPEIVVVLLGPKWKSAIFPLQVLPLVMPLTLISPVMNTAFQGIGLGRIVLLNVATAAIVMPAAFWIGASWGLHGLCFAWLLAFPLVLAVNLRRMLPVLGLPFRRLATALWPSFLCGAVMYGTVVGARAVASPGADMLATMIGLIAVGAVTYAALSWMVNRGTTREFTDLILRGRR